MDYSDEDFYMLALSFVEGLTQYQKNSLLEKKGSAEAVFLDSYGETGTVSDIIRRQKEDCFKMAYAECELLVSKNIDISFVYDRLFPFRLRNCADSPLVLYHKGTLDANRKYALTVVGSRKSDEVGERYVRELLEYLSPYKNDLVLTCGFATGIDAAVLRYARQFDLYTVCLIPHGFGHCYETEIEKRICSASCVMTENHFKFGYGGRIYEQRNRIIVGMSDALVVAQAKDGNGAGLYVGKALDYNRETFAYCYPEESPEMEKCNRFIADDLAIPLYRTEDFFEKMVWPWTTGR